MNDFLVVIFCHTANIAISLSISCLHICKLDMSRHATVEIEINLRNFFEIDLVIENVFFIDNVKRQAEIPATIKYKTR